MTDSVAPRSTDRAGLMAALAAAGHCDVAVVGGGATGLGVALDAALRGLSVVLVESHDFAKGTSSRATKLVHGGVRYLAQGNIALVYEALRERSILLRNAPHLAGRLPFVMPGYRCWQAPVYGAGLKFYDALAGKAGLGATRFLSPRQTRRCLPNIQSRGLKAGVKYWDGQFDDARLAVALARTAAAQGALLVNYCAATGLLHEGGRVAGVRCTDMETGADYAVRAKCVINATGVWVDELRRKDGAAMHRPVASLVEPSQGVHLVVDRDFLPGGHALLVPGTRDGRVLFAVPWLGKVILGTTDTPCHHLSREPRALSAEVGFILEEAANYLCRAPTRDDVRSVWAGLRPLVRPAHGEGGRRATKRLSREHSILVGASGLVTVTGGKWTTYRAMAEDVLDECVAASLLPPLAPGRTADFPLVGAARGVSRLPPRQGPPRRRARGGAAAGLSAAPGPALYGTESGWLETLPGYDCELCEGLTQAMVRFAARHEYARTVEDMLARRSRLLFLDAALAARVAPRVAEIMREELGRDPKLEEFLLLAGQYLRLPD